MNIEVITKESLNAKSNLKGDEMRLINFAQDVARFMTNNTLEGIAKEHGFSNEEAEEVLNKLKSIL